MQKRSKTINDIVTILDLDRSGIEREMMRMGVHRTGIAIMGPKSDLVTAKIKNVLVTAANIIKQDMLSCGGDAATAYGAVDHSITTTDVLIFGTRQQFELLIDKLNRQYFGLKGISLLIKGALSNYDKLPAPIKIKGKTFDFGRRTYIMGILNITPDSFSDGGQFISLKNAVDRGRQMLDEGADIIDIGGESTRPGASPVTAKQEMERVIPVIRSLSRIKGAVISIDTTKSKVASKAIKAGASMINDISALRSDRNMAKVVSQNHVPVILMHMLGNPRTMQKNPRYNDLMSDIISYLQNSIGLAIKGGVLRSKIIVDPGFGFGKTVGHNLEILRRLRELKVLGCPVLIGTSRKSTIGKVLDLSADQRVEGTAATVAAAIAGGANIVRVHDVVQMARVVKMCDAIYRDNKWQ